MNKYITYKSKVMAIKMQVNILQLFLPVSHFHWGKELQKLLGNFFLLPLKVLESPYQTTTFHQRISPKPVGQKKILSFIESNTIGKSFSVYEQDDFPPNHLTTIAGCVDCSVIGTGNRVRHKLLNQNVFFTSYFCTQMSFSCFANFYSCTK